MLDGLSLFHRRNSHGTIAFRLAKDEIAPTMSSPLKALLYSIVNLVAAACVYAHLISGGWLSNSYQLNDPNIVNLVLAIFEPIAAASVIAYWIWRTRGLYRLLFVLCLSHVVIGAGFLVFILAFMLFWQPKLM